MAVLPRSLLIVCIVGLGAMLLLGCSSSSKSKSPAATDQPGAAGQSTAVAPETNPPGDIPDNQQFVTYHSAAGGYSMQVPEGWTRTESGPNVQFVDKLNSISVDVVPTSASPAVDSVRSVELPQLQQQADAFEEIKVEVLDLPSGPAVLIRYRTNSAPDAVTGKRVRLEIDRYDFFKSGREAALSLSAPAGSDNVDVWNQISRSFAWD